MHRLANVVAETVPEFFHLTRERFDAVIVLATPRAGDLVFGFGMAHAVEGLAHRGLLDVGGIAHAGELRAEKFLFALLPIARAERDLIFPIDRAVLFDPH